MNFFKKLFKGKDTDETEELSEEEIQEEELEEEIKEEVEKLTSEVVEIESATTPMVEEIEPRDYSEEVEEYSFDDYDEDSETEEMEDIEEKEEEKPKGFFQKMVDGLDKTRQNIMSGIEGVLSAFTVIDDALFDELEEALILADMGVETSVNIIEKLRNEAKKNKATTVEDLRELLIKDITEILTKDDNPLELKSPTVILVIGVNGVGKTTTIGKLTHVYKEEGKKVILAAADTFRAAAIDQLQIWADRNNVDIVKHQANSDPAAVVFDGVKAAKARNADILICDTAGRLHNKKNLMDELKKMHGIIDREYPEADLETFLVLDATTGQNALQQAKSFNEVTNITGIVLTKLDGTAKGGIIVAIKDELNVPIRYIGVGEGINDLQEFNPEEFARALFGNTK